MLEPKLSKSREDSAVYLLGEAVLKPHHLGDHRVMELYRDMDGTAPFVREPAVKYMRLEHVLGES